MQETPMLFPMAPAEFWKQIRSTIEEIVNKKLNQQPATPLIPSLAEKALLKDSEVCAIFRYQNPLFMIG